MRNMTEGHRDRIATIKRTGKRETIAGVIAARRVHR
jgi:hypothetical protein